MEEGRWKVKVGGANKGKRKKNREERGAVAYIYTIKLETHMLLLLSGCPTFRHGQGNLFFFSFGFIPKVFYYDKENEKERPGPDSSSVCKTKGSGEEETN